jgi:hypothetical protein
MGISYILSQLVIEIDNALNNILDWVIHQYHVAPHIDWHLKYILHVTSKVFDRHLFLQKIRR